MTNVRTKRRIRMNSDKNNLPKIQGLSSVDFISDTQGTEPPKYVFSFADRLFSLIAIALMILMMRAIPIGENPPGSAIVLLLLFTFGAVYLAIKGTKFKIRHYIFLGVSVIFCVAITTCADGFIRSLTFLGLSAAFLAWIYDAGGLAGDRLRNDSLISHIIKAVFINPFSNLGAMFKGVRGEGADELRSKNVLSALGLACLGLCIAVVPTVIVIVLLSYDSQFTDLLDDIFSFESGNLGDWILDIILALPLSLLLFSAVYTVSSKMKQGEEKLLDLHRVSTVPRSLLYAAVTPMLLIYVIFFISQWTYFVSAFSGVLPEGLTYAQYARNGFFDLCGVSFINMLTLLFFCIFIKRKANGERGAASRVYTVIISVFSLVLVAIALSKMILYISYYGLTPSRVYSSWFIILLALLFLVILIGQIVPRFPYASVGIIGAVTLFAFLAVPNVDSIIADYNVDRYLEGELSEIDVDTLDRLGLSSVPARVRLEEELEGRSELSDYEKAALDAVRETLDDDAESISKADDSFFSFSFAKSKAQRLLNERAESR